ncbi:MAG TPA: hypothetical protein VNC50_14235 [Planctomycetia bacterium]|nr:hypothetical protein [Planctomycetia bacterium]
MNQTRSRRLFYLLAIVALLTASIGVSGRLDAIAAENRLAQESLGEVDPVSGTAQMVCFGFRGVAVTFLWNDVIEMQKKERWYEIRPLLNSITLLQPNFIRPWQYQGWNMAYNIAAQWESVADKYHWIKEGINFMQEACAKNALQPDLEWYAGYMYYNRFTISDEVEYLRELFRRETEDLNYVRSRRGREPYDPMDKAFDWFDKSRETVFPKMNKPTRMGIAPFLSNPSRALMSYAEFQAKEGHFGQKSREAWREAYEEWLRFGKAYGYAKEPGLSERHAYIHRFEYEPEEWKQLTEEDRYWSERHANIVRYSYWKRRALAETTEEMEDARRLYYEAEKAFRKEGNYELAVSKYVEAFPKWRKLLQDPRFKDLADDQPIQEESQMAEAAYLRLLGLLGRKAPERRPFDGLFEPLMPSASPGAPQQPKSDLPTGDLLPPSGGAKPKPMPRTPPSVGPMPKGADPKSGS